MGEQQQCVEVAGLVNVSTAYCRILTTDKVVPCVESVRAFCVEERQEAFQQGFDFVCFDSFWLSMITLFQICTLEGWTPIMYTLSDCEGPVQIYFISFLLICSFLMLNLVVGVICDAYSNVVEEYERENGPSDPNERQQEAFEKDASYAQIR